MTAPYTPDSQGYAQQPSYALPAHEVEALRSNSTIVLVLGILGLVLIGFFGSVPAWIWGNSILKKAAAAGVPEDYVSNARFGKILGIIGTVLGLIGLVVVIIFFGAVITAVLSGQVPTN